MFLAITVYLKDDIQSIKSIWILNGFYWIREIFNIVLWLKLKEKSSHQKIVSLTNDLPARIYWQ